MTYWCAVQTHVRSEDKAAFHLRRQGYEVFLPKHLKRRKHARRIDWVSAPLFPRYLFVAIDPDTTTMLEVAIFENTAIPEFTTLLAPIVSVIGIVCWNYRRREAAGQ